MLPVAGSLSFGPRATGVFQLWLGIVIVLAAVAACGDDALTGPPPPGPEPVVLAGIWDFTETLIISRQVVVCRDTGSFSFDQNGKAFLGTGGLIGTCTGLLSTFRNESSFGIDSGSVSGNSISFTVVDGCRYIGTVIEGQPRRIRGSSACSINFDGTWEAVEGRAIATVGIEPDSLAMVVGETVQLTAVLESASGARIFERPVTWATSDPATLEVGEHGTVMSRDAGPAIVTVTAEDIVGEASLSAEFVRFAAADGGVFHACGTSDEGVAYCWGRNHRGQTGTTLGTLECEGDSPCRAAPGAVSRSLEFTTVSAGFENSCGVTTDGNAYCWGANEFGQLGNGSLVGSPTPVAVSGGVGFGSLSAGSGHVCALAGDGSAYCWGDNSSGQLGVGPGDQSAVPAPVSGNLTFDAVTSGGFHTCALLDDNTVRCWGDNFGGQLGVEISTRRSTIPVEAVSGFTFSSISAGGLHMCGIATPGGGAYCWGENTDRQLGIDSVPFSPSLVTPSGDLEFVSITSGGFHTCALTEDGSAYCWGRNQSGQLGIGSTGADVHTPSAVLGDLKFAQLIGGAFFTCGVTDDGVLYCWGSNVDGELGSGMTTPSAEPVRVAGQP